MILKKYIKCIDLEFYILYNWYIQLNNKHGEAGVSLPMVRKPKLQESVHK